MRRIIKLPDCNVKIVSETCGTAAMRTVYLKADCEMDIEEAESVILSLQDAIKWLATVNKGCDVCELADECEERE